MSILCDEPPVQNKVGQVFETKPIACLFVAHNAEGRIIRQHFHIDMNVFVALGSATEVAGCPHKF
jgi:hypothetical protein